MINKLINFQNNSNIFEVDCKFIDDLIDFINQQETNHTKQLNLLMKNNFIGSDTDISQDVTQEKIRKYQEQYDLTIKANNLTTWLWNHKDNIIKIEGYLIEKLKLTDDTLSPEKFFTYIHNDDRKKVLKQFSKAQKTDVAHVSFECKICHKNLIQKIWIKVGGSIIEKDSKKRPTKYFGIIEDISMRNERKNTLKYLTQIDILTNCWNRLYFDRYFENELNKNSIGTIALIDVDFFKKINDRFGHQIGDDILKKIANFLKNSIATKGVLARIGGEEFGVILPNFSLEESKIFYTAIKENLFNSSLEDINPELKNIKISVTIGIANYSKSFKARTIFKTADDALYRGKRLGRNCVVCRVTHE